ncbi:hypothetical protein BD289DRAFT_158950, partial [Coniella lustricola]
STSGPCASLASSSLLVRLASRPALPGLPGLPWHRSSTAYVPSATRMHHARMPCGLVSSTSSREAGTAELRSQEAVDQRVLFWPCYCPSGPRNVEAGWLAGWQSVSSQTVLLLVSLGESCSSLHSASALGFCCLCRRVSHTHPRARHQQVSRDRAAERPAQRNMSVRPGTTGVQCNGNLIPWQCGSFPRIQSRARAVEMRQLDEAFNPSFSLSILPFSST